MNDSLGDRMKCYEAVPKNFLIRKTPVIIRLDGKAFHSFTKGFKKPFDAILMVSMQQTMKYLCKNIQNCVLGYTQSDEITLVLCDYQRIETTPWFDYNVEKMTSISASMATMEFNRVFSSIVKEKTQFSRIDNYYASLLKAVEKGAIFDSRCFNLPKEEVANCLIWRQQDAIRNSIQAVGQANFSHKQLEGVSCNEIQEMLFQEKQINWGRDFSIAEKQGSCCVKTEYECDVKDKNGNPTGEKTTRHEWVIDYAIPIFTQDREYIESKIVFN